MLINVIFWLVSNENICKVFKFLFVTAINNPVAAQETEQGESPVPVLLPIWTGVLK